MCDYNDDLLETHQKELKQLYPEVEVHAREFDAADEAEVEKVVKEAVDKYGRLDIFFANAGIATGAIFTETTSEDFMEVMRVNTLRFVHYITMCTFTHRLKQCLPCSQTCSSRHAQKQTLYKRIHNRNRVRCWYSLQCWRL